MTRGEWLGSITPPAPKRIEVVCAATWAISTAVRRRGDELRVVVLGVPDPLVAVSFRDPRHFDTARQALAHGLALADRGEVEDRQRGARHGS